VIVVCNEGYQSSLVAATLPGSRLNGPAPIAPKRERRPQ
jgi:hypothetical protein